MGCILRSPVNKHCDDIGEWVGVDEYCNYVDVASAFAIICFTMRIISVIMASCSVCGLLPEEKPVEKREVNLREYSYTLNRCYNQFFVCGVLLLLRVLPKQVFVIQRGKGKTALSFITTTSRGFSLDVGLLGVNEVVVVVVVVSFFGFLEMAN